MKSKLDNTIIQRKERPVRMLQFGEGNFLRAFVDWMVQVSNSKGVTDLNVAVVPPRFHESESIARLREQDGLYNIILEGVEKGEPKRGTCLVECVSEIVVPVDEPDRYNDLIVSPELRFVVSNTTEAGIRYESDDVKSDIPVTFPGKITNMLWRRWKFFDGDMEKGLVFMCCELIENNSSILKAYVLRYSREAGLPEEFMRWVEESCIFVDTLVDRIVPGFPKDNIDEINKGLGYVDRCVVKGELYHLWAIGGDEYEQVQKELPFDKAGLNVLYMSDIKGFRDKKVRVLNGSHTGMTAVALQMGCETVKEAFDNPEINKFVKDMVFNEVLPTVEGDRQQLRFFADGILERFRNPYIQHYLKSIALNSLSKWEARNWPVVKDFYTKTGKIPERETFTLAALLHLYGADHTFEPQDNGEYVERIRDAWNPDDFEKTADSILESGVFVENFGAVVPGLTTRIGEYLKSISCKGMSRALHEILE